MEQVDSKRGFFKRVRSGWFAGLQQLDPMICLETALLALIFASLFVSCGPARGRLGQMGGPATPVATVRPVAPSGSPTVVWSRPGTATLRKSPSSSATAGAVRLAAYTPLEVVEPKVNGSWLLVTATLPSGARAGGFVLSTEVQVDNPVTRMSRERGVLKVTRDGGAVTYLAPHTQAAATGTRAQKGRQLTLLGRVRKADAAGAGTDFLLAETDRPARGEPRQFWISAADVRVAAAPR